MDLQILVAYHKPSGFIKEKKYLPIHVGALSSSFKLEIQRDDEGDNISDKNTNFCELTALYWAWKNLKGIDAIGLCHYRRFFNFNKPLFKRRKAKRFIDFSFNQRKYLKVKLLFWGYDIILTSPYDLTQSVKDDYNKMHIPSDLDALENLLKEMYPKYFETWLSVREQTTISAYNMFITKWSIFDDYCSWLFSILFELEKRIEIQNDSYQRRVFGFMSERLLNLYVVHNNLRVKYLPVLFVENA